MQVDLYHLDATNQHFSETVFSICFGFTKTKLEVIRTKIADSFDENVIS